MKRLLMATLALAGCTTTEIRPDLADLNHTLGGPAVAPPPAQPLAAPPRVDEPVTAERAVELAVAHHPGLRATMAELARARGERVQAGAWPTPTLEAGFSRELGGDDHADEIELGVAYDLSGLLWTPNRITVADGALDAARARLAAEILRVRQGARLAAYTVQAATRRRGLRFDALRNQQAAWETAVELHRIGSFSDLNLAQERVAVEAARLAVADAELALREAEDALARAVGVPGLRVVPGLPALPTEVVPAGEIERTTLEKSWDLSQLRAQLAAAAAHVDGETGRAWLPHLGVGVHTHREEGEWKAGGHLSLGLPGVDAGRGRVATAEAELARLQHRYAEASAGLRIAVRGAWARAESTRKQAIHLQDALLPARRAVLAETIKSYNAMQIGVFQLLEVQRAVLETEVQTVDATLRALQARAALDGLLAGAAAVPFEAGAAPTPMPVAPAGGHGGH